MTKSNHYFSLLSYRSEKLKNRILAFNSDAGRTDMSFDFFDDLICYFDNPDMMQAHAFKKYDVQTLVHYLEICHDEYLNRRIPALFRNLQEAIKLSPSGTLLEKQGSFLFLEFARELKLHFDFEETNLFPYAREISKESACHLGIQYSTKQFELEHPSLIIDADKLLKFLDLHAEGFTANIAFNMLQKKLQELKTDIDLHELLEVTVLIPKLKDIERLKK